MSVDYIANQNLTNKFNNILKVRGHKTNGFSGSTFQHSSTHLLNSDYLISTTRINTNIKSLEEQLIEFQKSNYAIKKSLNLHRYSIQKKKS